MSDNLIKAKKIDNYLILELTGEDEHDEDSGKKAIADYVECWGYDDKFDDFGCDELMYEFFEEFISNTEWEWISPEDIGALTSAPILGIRDEEENVIEAYGFMDYQVTSLMEELRHGEVRLLKGF